MTAAELPTANAVAIGHLLDADTPAGIPLPGPAAQTMGRPCERRLAPPDAMRKAVAQSASHVDSWRQAEVDTMARLANERIRRMSEEGQRLQHQMAQQATGPLAACIRVFRALRGARQMGDTLPAHATAVLGAKAALLDDNRMPDPPRLDNPRGEFAIGVNNLVEAANYGSEINAALAKYQASSSGAFSPDETAFMSFIRGAVRAIDPNGDHCSSGDPGWKPHLKDCLDLSRDLGLDLIYPQPGTPVDYERMELQGLEHGGGMRSDTVVRVQAPGYVRAGKVMQKAQVKVAR